MTTGTRCRTWTVCEQCPFSLERPSNVRAPRCRYKPSQHQAAAMLAKENGTHVARLAVLLGVQHALGSTLRSILFLFVILVVEEGTLCFSLAVVRLHELGVVLSSSAKAFEMLVLAGLREVGQDIDAALPKDLQGILALVIDGALRREQ